MQYWILKRIDYVSWSIKWKDDYHRTYEVSFLLWYLSILSHISSLGVFESTSVNLARWLFNFNNPYIYISENNFVRAKEPSKSFLNLARVLRRSRGTKNSRLPICSLNLSFMLFHYPVSISLSSCALMIIKNESIDEQTTSTKYLSPET